MKKLEKLALVLMFLALGFLGACHLMADDLQFNIHFKDIEGLQEGARVYFKDYPVGSVKSIRVRADGDFLVLVVIRDAQRAAASKTYVFILDDDPEQPGKKAIMIKKEKNVAPVPIREGETVRGYSSLDYYLQKNQEMIRRSSEKLRETFQRFFEELRGLPQSDDYQELKRSMKEALEELLREGEEYKQKIENEILPDLQRRIEELRRDFPWGTQEKEPAKPAEPDAGKDGKKSL
jgi:hypothetical protein